MEIDAGVVEVRIAHGAVEAVNDWAVGVAREQVEWRVMDE